MNKDPFWERENKKQIDFVLERAKQGDIFSVFTFAEYLYNGTFVDKDIHEAAKWYKLAADEGHAGAIEKLHEMFVKGEIAEYYNPPYEPPKPKKSSTSFFGGNKKSSNKPRKKVYDGNFASYIDEDIVAGIYNDREDDDEDGLAFFEYKDNHY